MCIISVHGGFLQIPPGQNSNAVMPFYEQLVKVGFGLMRIAMKKTGWCAGCYLHVVVFTLSVYINGLSKLTLHSHSSFNCLEHHSYYP